MQLIDGKKIANEIYLELKAEIQFLKAKPKLGIILANDDEASRKYVKLKVDKATELGMEVDLKVFNFNEGNPQQLKLELIEQIIDFNTDSKISGFLIQLPLHNTIRDETNTIINLINPKKDIDGLTAISLGKTAHELKGAFMPATVEGILECINQTLTKRIDWLENSQKNSLEGKNIAIINNSNLIGKPLSNILISKNATVTILNKLSTNIREICQTADIVITATGSGQLLDHTYFKDGSTVIDITSKSMGKKVLGDVILSSELVEKISWLTPVPGGVGPLTVAFLMRNLVKAHQNRFLP